MNVFHSPWWGLLIIPMALCLVLHACRRKPALALPSIQPLSQAGSHRKINLLLLPVAIYFLGFASLIIALMRPQLGTEKTIRTAEGIDIILALDVSGSMQGYDVPADITSERQLYNAIRNGTVKTRVDIAKQALENFVGQRPDDRIGLIAFATLPFVASPPTLDHDFLLGHLKRLEAGTLGDHTGIAGPIASGTTRLKDSDAKRRVMVLFTDGANTYDDRITPQQAAKIAKTFDVIIYTVGIGGERTYRLVQGFGGMQLRPQRSDFNEKLLQEISEITGGRNFRAGDAESFARVMEEIDTLETIELDAPVYIDYQERYFGFLVTGLILVLLAFILEKTVFLVAP